MSKKIVGFNDLRKKEEEEEHGQEYYTGGVDNRGGGSGLNVVDPADHSRRGGNGIYQNILDRASADTRELASNGTPAATTHTITLYSNGFVLNDGPLRPMNDPENMTFLQYLMKGKIPPELKSEDGTFVDINLVDKTQEEYVPPSYIAFSGQANVLSSSSSTSAQGFTIATLPEAPAVAPGTTILTQVKTHDGKKLRVKINTTRSVREYIALVLAEAKKNGSNVPSDGTIVISSGFPPKELTDGDQNVVDAGLTNASVTYKFI